MIACQRPITISILIVGCILEGCSQRPQAPALIDELVYEYTPVGIRFRKPDGWTLASKAILPAEALPKPIVMIRYIQNHGDRPAEMDLVAAEVPVESDLGQFLADYRIGPEKWKLVKPGEPLTINGVEAIRYEFVQAVGSSSARRESTAFRKGGRVYAFFLSYQSGDLDNLTTGRKCVESTIWKK